MGKYASQINRRLILGTLAFLLAGTLLAGLPFLFSRPAPAGAAAPRGGAPPRTNPSTNQ
jgi:hypothetical protein